MYYVLPTDLEQCIAKTCSQCREVRPVEEYSKDASRKFGINNVCKSCGIHNSAIRVKSTSKIGNTTLNAESKRYTYLRNSSRTDEKILEDQIRKRPEGTKICKTCRETKELAEYYVCRSNGDGLQAECKACRKAKQLIRYSKPYVHYWTANNIPLRCYLCDGPYEEIEHLIPTSHPNGYDLPSNTLPACIKCNRGTETGKWNTPLEEYIFKVNHPTKTRAQILHEIIMRGDWPFTNTTPLEFVHSFKLTL